MSRKNSKKIVEVNQTVSLGIDSLVPDVLYKVREVRNLSDSAYIIRFDRNDMDFTPGQHITLGLPGDTQIREYSIYSPNNVDYLEVLVKEVEDGLVSKRLKRVKKGDILKVDGPFGFFTLDSKNLLQKEYLFIATGTGIAPFHSIAKSLQGLNYKILHGIRFGAEKYESHEYKNGNYISCTSRDNLGNFQGRVTDYLASKSINSDTLVYLCGNYEMIQSVYDLLTNKGFSPDNIRTEVYF